MSTQIQYLKDRGTMTLKANFENVSDWNLISIQILKSIGPQSFGKNQNALVFRKWFLTHGTKLRGHKTTYTRKWRLFSLVTFLCLCWKDVKRQKLVQLPLINTAIHNDGR